MKDFRDVIIKNWENAKTIRKFPETARVKRKAISLCGGKLRADGKVLSSS